MELVSNCQFGVSFYDAQLALSVLASIVKIYQTQRAVFDHIFKHFEVRQKYSTPRRIFNSLNSVWTCGEKQLFVFDK